MSPSEKKDIDPVERVHEYIAKPKKPVTACRTC